ncbi:MAG: sensor histidine kinase [Planctomycetota bacterium]
MSLRARILTAIFLVNLLVLGALAFLLHLGNVKAVETATLEFRDSIIEGILEASVYRPPRREPLRTSAALREAERKTMRRLLDYDFKGYCRDVLLADNTRVPEGSDRRDYLYMYLNPLGAYGRDHETFATAEVIGAIQAAMESGGTKVAQGGFARSIEGKDGCVLGGGWFLLPGAAFPSLPFLLLLTTIGLGILVLGGITYFGLDRWVLGPLGRLSVAAGSLQRGELGTQVEAGRAGKEVTQVVNSFNRASLILQESERKLAQAVEEATERAARRERELIRSGRLAALGTLAAGIAHEINNPLGAMVNAVDRLKKGKEPSEEVVYLRLLEEGLERVGRIVRRTLEFAPRTSAPVPFRISEAAERARALVHHRADREGVEISIQKVEGDIVGGDPHELTQVFLNLFLNSLDAFNEENEEKAAHPKISVSIDGQENRDQKSYVILVRDNGPGVGQETLERMFDPFFSTKGATSKSEKLSSGLGMSISFVIVEQHDGSMSVRSKPGEGFEVRIELPAHRGETENRSK